MRSLSGADFRVVETVARERADGKVLEQDIGAAREIADDLLAFG